MDHCSGWPDGWPSWLGGTGSEWAGCCKAHDEFYAGQTSLDLIAYLGAHYDLAACVAGVNWGMAAAMFAGLCTLGFPYLVHRHNKHRPGQTRRER